MSLDDINYPQTMGRWQPDARGRLGRAALELFEEQGFDATTVAEIAERAGLTKRTFFRYFTDKREVLFRGREELEELVVTGVLAAPQSASPLEAAGAGLDAAADMFEELRPFSTRRQRVIAAAPELQERELIKLSTLAAAVAQALRRRGVTDPAATLSSEAAITVFRVAFERWVEDGNRQSLAALIQESLDQLRAVTAT
jgi:AcrR family transcriptional regulator